MQSQLLSADPESDVRSPERVFSDAFQRLVNTGKLREVVQQMIPILTYHARETVYRAGSDFDRVYNRQYVTLPDGELFSVSVTVELLEGS